MKRATEATARTIVRWRYLVVAGWVIVAIASSMLLPGLDDDQTNSLDDLVATDADAVQAEVRAAELFGFPLLSRTIVVQRDPEGLSARALARVGRNVARLNAGGLERVGAVAFALGFANVLGEPPFSREESTTALTYLFFPLDIGPFGQRGVAQLYADRYLDEPGDSFAGVTGAAPARAVQSETISDWLPVIELATLALVTLALAFHFRAPAPPLVNLVAVAVAFTVSIRVIGFGGEALDVAVPAEIKPVLVALLFGIVTDYAIFLLARARRRMRERDALPATIAATADLLPTIVVAGLTVAAATATLGLARLGFFQAFGPGLAISALVALAVATTLIPALIAIAGERLFWPALRSPAQPEGHENSRRQGSSLRRSLAALPARRPALVMAVSAIPLAALSAAVLGLEVGNRTITSLPHDAEPKTAYREASRGFAPGILAPTVIIAEDEGITDRRPELRRLQELISRRRGVAEVIGPGQLRQPLNLGAAYSRTGDAARYFVVLNMAPYGNRAIETVQALDAELPELLREAGLPQARAALAGDTAISAETVKKSGNDIGRVVPAASLAVFVILAVFLRALVAPLYLVATSLLALGASLGLTVLVFQHLLGYGELEFYVPFAATVLLVALGSDYNVYLAGSVWREARKRPLARAVEVAGGRAAASIATAGVVLAASFAMIALIPLRPFQELAFAVSAGLLLDAFVVRALLTPALITLVGVRGGWPGNQLAPRDSAADADHESDDECERTANDQNPAGGP